MTEGDKRLYPAFLDLEGRLCVVVGEGSSAEKRARQLARYGADVVIVTPNPSGTLVQAEADGTLSVEARSYVRGDLGGATLALCITDDAELRRAVHDEAESVGCLVNISGDLEASSFLVPSVIHREPLQIAITTGGMAPEAAKALRREIQTTIGEDWTDWLALIAAVRAQAFADTADSDLGRRAVEVAGLDETHERLKSGEAITAESVFAQAYRAREDEQTEASETIADDDAAAAAAASDTAASDTAAVDAGNADTATSDDATADPDALDETVE